MEDLHSEITSRRIQTRRSVYNFIYNSPSPVSKKDIAIALGISLPTLYQNINELIEAGYIEYCGEKTSSGGRPASLLRAVTDIHCAIGISITIRRLSFALTDLSREEKAFKSVENALPVGDSAYHIFLAEELEKFIDENGIDRSKILGIGLTVPGIVHPDSGNVFFAPTLHIRNLSLSEIASSISYPVYIENDANSGGFAEWFNNETGGSIAYVSLSEGLGGAFIVDGKQYVGSNYRAGEFGHMCVEPGGRKCACGKLGCLEAYCSPYRIEEDSGMSIATYFKMLSDGNLKAWEIWKDYKKHLVAGLHNIRMALDCDIVLGGSVSEYLTPYLDEIKTDLAKTDPFETDCGYLRIAASPSNSTIIGIALVFIRDFVDNI